MYSKNSEKSRRAGWPGGENESKLISGRKMRNIDLVASNAREGKKICEAFTDC